MGRGELEKDEREKRKSETGGESLGSRCRPCPDECGLERERHLQEGQAHGFNLARGLRSRSSKRSLPSSAVRPWAAAPAIASLSDFRTASFRAARGAAPDLAA